MAVVQSEFVISGHLAGQFTQTILHANVDTTSSPDIWSATLDTANQLISSGGMMEALTDALPQDWIGSSLRVRQVDPGGPSVYLSASLWVNQNGQRSGGITSAQVNPCCIWIPTTSPTKTGRTFLPGVTDTDCNAMVYDPAFITAVNAFMANYIGGGTGTDITWSGCVFRRATGFGDAIQGSYLSPHVGTQRRRLTPV